MRVGLLFLSLVMLLSACTSPEVSLEDRIKESLIGYELTYYTIAGLPETFVISEFDIISIEEATYQKEEFYKVRVGEGLSWNLYLDKETFEVVHTEQLFVT
ncbi:MAG: hypothetical protein ISS25_03350 [Nanoarchaeota archaeon]|nr:hypothetical protein [DPANN group archaeon]MBL7116837.1 hypothetical protein [Nanoarchaeota archaeon]